MKTSTLIAFFSGFATACVALYVAGAAFPVLIFAAGAAASPAASLAFLMASKPARLAAARILNVWCTIHARPTIDYQTPPPRRVETKRPAAPPTMDSHPDQADLVSALVNFGARKPCAVAAAREAIKIHPAANFDDRFRYAVNCAKARAR
jgi:hypothetical protein